MNQSDHILVYDNSFNGFLTAVYRAFRESIEVSDIRKKTNTQSGLFSKLIEVKTDDKAAKRVWNALQKKNYTALKSIYFAFLSEAHGIEIVIYQYIKFLFSENHNLHKYFSDESINRINLLASLVSREKRRHEAGILFRNVSPDLEIATVEPAFNVLPLLSRFFKSNNREKQWILFDSKRKYGIYYDAHSVKFVSAGFVNNLLSQRQLLDSDYMLSGLNSNNTILHNNKPVSAEKLEGEVFNAA